MVRPCVVCGRDIACFESTKDKRIYCSLECKRKVTHIKALCEECGREYLVARSRYEDKGIRYHFCSNACYQKSIGRSKHIITTSYIHTCDNCGKIFKGSRKRTKTGLFFCSNACSNACSAAYQKGDKSPAYKGGAFNNGYRVDKIDGKYKLRHRAIMEKHLGRKLTRSEVVHHKDENRLNNDISNLQLMTKSEHDRYHADKRAEERRNAKK